MAGQQHSFLRGNRLGVWFALSVIVLLVVFPIFYQLSSPEGVYYDPNLACEYGVWIFKDGKVSIHGDNEKPQEVGVYVKSSNQWIVGTNISVLKPSVLGITVYNPAFTNGHMFWFRARFSWIIDCEDWLQRHF